MLSFHVSRRNRGKSDFILPFSVFSFNGFVELVNNGFAMNQTAHKVLCRLQFCASVVCYTLLRLSSSSMSRGKLLSNALTIVYNSLPLARSRSFWLARHSRCFHGSTTSTEPSHPSTGTKSFRFKFSATITSITNVQHIYSIFFSLALSLSFQLTAHCQYSPYKMPYDKYISNNASWNGRTAHSRLCSCATIVCVFVASHHGARIQQTWWWIVIGAKNIACNYAP